MSHADPSVLSTHPSPRSVPYAAFALLLIPFIAALAIAQAVGPHPSAGASAGARDPLLAPGVIEFRQAERLSAAAAAHGDQLSAPGVIEFRRGERLSSGAAAAHGDPLRAPGVIEFRRGERVGASDHR